MLTNNAEFNKSDLLAIFHDNSLINFPDNFISSGVSTDTRTIKNGDIFVALAGETSDGHSRIKEAFSKGASAAIVNQDWYNQNKDISHPLIIINNTLHSLGKLANLYRNRFSIPLIAIGGANGKTTTKNITAHLLSQKFNILRTNENFNNQIGVPLMLLQLTNKHDIAVLEMGTNEPGEISILTSIMEPTHGLITNIGREHLEKLIDLDGVEQEETTLFAYLSKKNHIAFINFDDSRLKKYYMLFENVVSFGTDDEADVKAKIELDDDLHPIIDFSAGDRKFSVRLNTIGYTTALNALAATSIAFAFGLTDEEIINGLGSFNQPEGHGYGRMVLENINGITLINDCYNANPDSMTAALHALDKYKPAGKKYAVLGDMRELGEASFDEHCKILELVSTVADIIMITGDEMNKALDSVRSKKIEYFSTKDELSNELKKRIAEGDVVLVKGSRGMSMEKIIEKLKN